MHAGVMEIDAQAHPVLSKIFDFIGISNSKKKIKNIKALKGKNNIWKHCWSKNVVLFIVRNIFIHIPFDIIFM